MNILFISRYYPPEKAAAAVCVSETAKRLVTYGHEVTVLTTVPNYPTGVVPQKYRGRLLHVEDIDGVRVVRTWSYVSPNKGFFRRVCAYLSFGCLAAWLGRKALTTPDVIIVESPPLFTTIAAHLLTWRTKVPFIFWVADLWPESAVQLGAVRNRLLIRLAEWLEWWTYRRAHLVWAVTEGMRETLIRRGLHEEKVFLLHNGVDIKRFYPQSQSLARQTLDWHDQNGTEAIKAGTFTILYAGTHGLTHGLHTILDAAEQLHDLLAVHFVLVGDGAEKAKLLASAQRRQLTNVHFLDPIPHEQMPILLAASDICLAHTRKLPIFEAMLPMKMYEAMACGRALILALNGEARRIAEEDAEAAIYCEPENAQALAHTVRYLYTHPEVVTRLGQNGLTYVQAYFDYNTLTEKLNAQLQTIMPKLSLSQ